MKHAYHMICFILLLVLFTGISVTDTVRAADEIRVIENSSRTIFPTAIEFINRVSGASEIISVRLRYQVERLSIIKVVSEAWPKVARSHQVEAKWVWDMRRASLPPGAKVSYWWEIADAEGHSVKTATKDVIFNDSNHRWQEISSARLKLYWYEGNKSFAENIMSFGERGLARLQDKTGASPEKQVKMYIYGSVDDLQRAMIFAREWTGGAAYTEFSTVVLGVAPQTSQINWAERAIPHELCHLVVGQIAFSPYGNVLPTWLNEGLSLFAEGDNPDKETIYWLNVAKTENRLFTVRSLSSAFSAKDEEARISYAQSDSIVRFLISNYGKDAMLNLLKALKDGNTIDKSLNNIYGFDQDGLNEAWGKFVFKK